MVSLMAQLNANQDMSRVQVDIEGQVKDYINYILEHQLPSGWLGPDDGVSFLLPFSVISL